ncbi:ATP-binding protein [Spirosoma fluviale]|nr:ATP-binding protein [Spirosoma fluviale]
MTPYLLTPTVGTIPPDKIVGRDEELKKLRTLLMAQSVTIEEFRRMGKTLLVQKLEYLSIKQDEPNKVIYFMLQGVKDVTELTDVLLDTLRKQERLGILKVGWHGIKNLYNTFKPAEVKIKEVTFKLPEFKTKWKDALTACIKDLAARTRKDGEILTLVLDEFPVMLWDWLENDKSQDAIELLDLFRNLRIDLKEQGHIRFVVCGSVGMQVVLDRLRRKHNYTGEPFNDTKSFRLEPMNDADALFLCRCLALSGFTHSGDITILHQRIHRFAENLPFYINTIFQLIQSHHNGEINDDTINKAQESLLNDPDEAKVFNQLYQRIGIYYELQKADRMLEILNQLANQDGFASENDLQQHITTANKAQLLDALETLWKEQYLVRKIESGARHYQFKYNLIKQWWKLNKA